MLTDLVCARRMVTLGGGPEGGGGHLCVYHVSHRLSAKGTKPEVLGRLPEVRRAL